MMASHARAVGKSTGVLNMVMGERDGEDITLSNKGYSSLRKQPGRSGFKLAALLIAGCCLSVFWVLNDRLPTRRWKGRFAHAVTRDIAPFDLVKNQVISPTPYPAGVLECFQVYQPVLTPSGVTDETVLGDGAENTTTIAAAASETSCEVVLMQHDFAFSYGLPFVG